MHIELEFRTGAAILLNKYVFSLKIPFIARLGIHIPHEHCGDRPDVTLASKGHSDCSPSVMGSLKKLPCK